MFRWLDESPILNKFLPKVSEVTSKNRGVPILVGIIFVVIAFGVQLINIIADNVVLELIQVVFHNVGILTALIGFLLIEPLR
jgi:hypothetical protein